MEHLTKYVLLNKHDYGQNDMILSKPPKLIDIDS